MNRHDHINEAERLLDLAKDVARQPKVDGPEDKARQVVVMDLLDFSRTHAAIASAMRPTVDSL